MSSGGKFKTLEQFISESNIKHNFKYDYSKTIYKRNSIKVIIICPIHKEFEQIPANHLAGSGCQKCGFISSAKIQTLSTEKFIQKAIEIHKDKYDYSETIYIHHKPKIIIRCKNCNTKFKQSPHHHLEGRGCKKCNSRLGWTKTEWLKICNNKKDCTPLVYIIRCFNEIEEFYKIGITSNSVCKRFKTKLEMPYSYEILKEIKGSPDFVYDKEIELHKLYKSYSYTPLISFAGETECFKINNFTF